MPNNENSWTTVSGKSKAKTGSSSNKSSGGTTNAPVIPQAEVKTIQLSNSTFSAMKSRLEDDHDDNEPGQVTKPVTTSENNAPVKVSKSSNKSASASLTLKQALQNIDGDKLKQIYQSSTDNTSLLIEKVCYWFIGQMREVTSGLNDPVFSKENNPEYPLNVLSTSTRNYLDEVFTTMKSTMKGIGLCRDGMLRPNAELGVVGGYQVLLQYFLRNLDGQDADAFLQDTEELATSLKRYPSDKVLRLLWAYSQVQYEHPALALKVWFRFMFPLVDNRTYNEFVIETLSQLTSRNAKNKKFLSGNDLFPIQSYLKLLDFVDRPNPALSRELRSSLAKSTAILSELFSLNTKNLSQHANDYFKELYPALVGSKERTTKSQAAIDRMIVACMNEKSVMKHWYKLHEATPQSSLNLLSLIQSNGSPKDLRTIVQQLRSISNEHNDESAHQEFLYTYGKTDKVVAKKRQTGSKSRVGFTLKFLLLLLVSFMIYQNWLWLTVASDYLIEDCPTAILMKKRFVNGFEETKKLSLSSIKYADEYARTSWVKLQPYAVQSRQYLQKQWSLVLKYIEGPVYDKTVEVAEEIQKISMVVFKRSVQYLNMFFERASFYAAQFAHSSEIYLRQFSTILYDKWSNFDATELRRKFEELRLRVVKSV